MSALGDVAAVQARYWCEAGPGKPRGGPYSVGYSQPDREMVYRRSDEEGWLTADANADCGTIVMGAINYGLHAVYGLPWGHPVMFDLDDWWTGNLAGGLGMRGFVELPWDDADLYPAGGLAVGDVILSEPGTNGREEGHVCIVTGVDGGGVRVSEAWIAEDGSADGVVGDSTGSETRTIGYEGHPDTVRGDWTHALRFAPAAFAAQHPDCVGAAQAPAPVAPPAPRGRLLGVDISNHQPGLASRSALDAVNPDFVVVMVSQGDWFTNPLWLQQLRAAYDAGRPIGVYHYIDGSGVEAEARHFVDTVRNAPGGDWAGYVMWALDWEQGENDAWGDEAYLSALVARVRELIGGRRIMLYASSGSYPWAVAAEHGCGTWVAQYAGSEPTGWDWDPWTDGTWSATMHQYAGPGRVPGYDDDLDLDLFHGTRADWEAYYGIAPMAPDGAPLLTVDGVWGPATGARFREVMGLAADAPWDGASPDPRASGAGALQYWLTWAVDADRMTDAIGAPALSVDGVDGPATIRSFQAWWNSCGVKAGHRIDVTGAWDAPTIEAVQHALNRSWAAARALATHP